MMAFHLIEGFQGARRGPEKVGWLGELRMIKIECIPSFEMRTTKRADWTYNSHPGKQAQARAETAFPS